MNWRQCLGDTDHWVTGDDQGYLCHGRSYQAECGAQAWVIGIGGVAARRCAECKVTRGENSRDSDRVLRQAARQHWVHGRWAFHAS